VTWLLYGAYGFTGRLLAAEAVRRGHRPILAGRRPEALEDVARELEALEPEVDAPMPGAGHVGSGGPEDGAGTPPGRHGRNRSVGLGRGDHEPGLGRGNLKLPRRSFPIDDPDRLRTELEGVDAVLHAAGPFIHTGTPMMEACIDVGAHYLDITGEVPVFESAFELAERAREAGVVLMPGVGMDVVPTDGAAAILVRALPSATRLELALHSPGRPSAGTLQTIVEGLPGGLLVRRGGRLVQARPGAPEFRRWVDLGPEVTDGPMAGKMGGRRSVAPYTWGDLSTAYRTTGIGDITCYMSTPRSQVRLLPFVLPVLKTLLSIGPVRRFARRRVARGPAGPGERARREGRTRVWGRAEDDQGREAETILEFPESYRFTALAGVRALEAVLALPGEEVGTLTPAGTFGVDWVLQLPEVAMIRSPYPPES
jgi:short subunit dehydrogenase-like uncharacterized protein